MPISQQVMASIGVRGAGAFLTFVVQLWFAKALGAQGYGTYSFISAVMILSSIVGVRGFDTAALKFIPGLMIRADPGGEVWGFLRHSATACALSSLLAGGVMLAVITFAEVSGSNLKLWVLAIAAAGVPALSFLLLFGSSAQSMGAPVISQVPLLVMRPVLTIIAIWLIDLAFESGLTLPVVISAEVVATGVAVAMSRIHLTTILASRVRSDFSVSISSEWMPAANGFFVLAALQTFVAQATIVITGLIGAPEAVGELSLAARITAPIVLALSAINTVSVPAISRYIAGQDFDSLARMSTWAARVSSGIAFGAALALVVYGRAVVNLIDAGYQDAYLCVLVLCFSQCINAAMGPVLYVLMMANHNDAAIGILGLTAAFQVCATLLLVPYYGAVGAALVQGAAIGAWNIAAAWWIWRRFGFDPSMFGMKRTTTTAR